MLIAIDPSINHLGIARIGQGGVYLDSLTLRPEKENRKNAADKIACLARQYMRFLADFSSETEEVVIEHTRFFARAGGQNHASAQKLNLVKGMIYGLSVAHFSVPVHMVWIPGFNKDKALMLARVQKLPEVSEHERDAFWLGHMWQSTPAPMRAGYLCEKEL